MVASRRAAGPQAGPLTMLERLPADAAPGALLLLACACWLVLVPSVELPLPLHHYDQNRVLQLALFCLKGLLLAFSGTLRGQVARQLGVVPAPAWAALALLGALALGSSLRAAQPACALAELGLFACTAMLGLVVGAGGRPLLPALREAVAIAVMLMIGLFLVRFAIAYVASRLTVAVLDVQGLYVGFGHIRFFSQWQSWTLPLAVLPFLSLRQPALRAAGLVLAALWWALHFGTGTRGTTLGLAVALAATPLLVRHSLPWLLTQLGCAAAGFGIAWVAFAMPDTIGGPFGPSRLLGDGGGPDASAMARIELLRAALELVREHPLLGIGPMHFAALPGDLALHPHNFVAQLAAEWGLPFTALALVLAAAAFRSWLRLLPASRDVSAMHPALTASAIAATVHGLVSGLLVTPTSQFMLALVFGLMLCEFNYLLAPYGAAAPGRPARTGGRFVAAGVPAVCLAALACWMPTVLRDLPRVAQRAADTAASDERLRPRLWQYGRITPGRGLDALTPAPGEADGQPQAGRSRTHGEPVVSPRLHRPLPGQH